MASRVTVVGAVPNGGKMLSRRRSKVAVGEGVPAAGAGAGPVRAGVAGSLGAGAAGALGTGVMVAGRVGARVRGVGAAGGVTVTGGNLHRAWRCRGRGGVAGVGDGADSGTGDGAGVAGAGVGGDSGACDIAAPTQQLRNTSEELLSSSKRLLRLDILHTRSFSSENGPPDSSWHAVSVANLRRRRRCQASGGARAANGAEGEAGNTIRGAGSWWRNCMMTAGSDNAADAGSSSVPAKWASAQSAQ
jgi:hypothetical protein